MSNFSELKQEFEAVASTQGFVTKDDYTYICAGIDDTVLLDTVAEWIVESGIPLRKDAVGPQYQQEVMRKVKNPNVRDVKDTKHRTHKNKDKFQECKKEVVEKEGSFHLNKLIETLKECENEFLPPWKKFDPDKSEVKKTASEKLHDFLQSNRDVVDLLAEMRVLAQMGYRPESIKEYVLSIVRTLGDAAYLPQFPQVSAVNFADFRQAEAALDTLDDTQLLRDIHVALETGDYSPVPDGQLQPEKSDWKQPSSVKEVEFGEEDMSAPGLELAANTHGKVVRVQFKNCPALVAAIADTADKKVAGLEPYESLKEREGLYFPFKEPDSVTFHMGKVKFPIDIIFLTEQPNGMEIGKVVEHAEPGTPDQWNAKKVKAVLEVAGGTCKRFGLTVGSQCTVGQLTLKGK